jgi:hypothetical protein
LLDVDQYFYERSYVSEEKRELTQQDFHAAGHPEQRRLGHRFKLRALLCCGTHIRSPVLVYLSNLVVDAFTVRITVSLAVLYPSCGRVTEADNEFAWLTIARASIVLLDNATLAYM